MPTLATDTFEVPATIAGLWSLCALTPILSRDAYEKATDVCNKLAVRKLNSVQREYHRELLALVEAYEDAHAETARTLAELRKLAG